MTLESDGKGRGPSVAVDAQPRSDEDDAARGTEMTELILK
jgi:hypothetical protein